LGDRGLLLDDVTHHLEAASEDPRRWSGHRIRMLRRQLREQAGGDEPLGSKKCGSPTNNDNTILPQRISGQSV
jgi:hypothetical protein